MNVVAERFIELCIHGKHRRLSRVERIEKRECLKYLENRQWELARLKNLSLMASMTGDAEWQHAICAEIEKLEG